ncbi:MAG: AsmA-like C-terminal region-containing protein [Spirochaetota bacterium]
MPQNFNLILILFILVQLFSILTLLLLIYPNLYRSVIVRQLNKSLPVKVTFSKLDIEYWPYIHVSLQDVRLIPHEYQLIPYMNFNKVEFILSWKAFFYGDRLVFKEVNIENGKVKLGKFFHGSKMQSQITSNTSKSRRLLSSVLQQIEENFEVDYLECRNLLLETQANKLFAKEDLFVSMLTASLHKFSYIPIQFQGKYGKAILDITAIVKMYLRDLSFYSTEIRSFVNVRNLSFAPYAPFIRKNLPNIILHSSVTSFEGEVVKLAKQSVFQNTIKANVNYFKYQNADDLSSPISTVYAISCNGKFDFDYANFSFYLRQMNLNAGKLGKTNVFGYLFFGNKVVINLKVKARYLDIAEIIKFSVSFAEGRIRPVGYFEKDFPNIYLKISISSSYAKYKNTKLFHTDGIIEMKKNSIDFEVMRTNIYGGRLKAIGNVLVHDTVKFYFDASINDVDVRKFSHDFLGETIIRGKLASIFRVRANVGEMTLADSLLVLGTAYLFDGSLFDKTNFLYPVVSLNQVLSLKESKNLSSFRFLKTNFLVKQSTIHLNDIDMQGKDLTASLKAKGHARVTFKRKVEANITVSASNEFLGRAIKVPIIYNSKKSIPYEIEPVWAASAVAGGILLANPATAILGTSGVTGVVVGGLAGSAASGRIGKFWKSIKSFFFGSGNTKEELSEGP